MEDKAYAAALDRANLRHVAAVLKASADGFAAVGGAPTAVPPPAASGPVPAGLRRVGAIPTPQLTPNTPAGKPPRFSEVDPALLLVEDSYQRGLSKRSIVMIRRIVADWSWAKFKPPVVTVTPAGLVVIDGQHTAIAAACHPLIHKLPVMVIETLDQEARAAAFVGHNRDRLNLTPMQVHHAAVIGGDQKAQLIGRVCAAAGVEIVKANPSAGFKPGQTMALGAIKALVTRRDEEQATTVLSVLADCSPVQSDWIKAVDLVLWGEEYAGAVTVETLKGLIAARREELETEAALFVAAHRARLWKALAVIAFRNAPKRRRKGGEG